VITSLRRTVASSPLSMHNALVDVSRGMQAIKLCSNEIVQLLTGAAS